MTRNYFDSPPTGDPLPPEMEKAVIKAMVKKALEGDTRAAAIVLEYQSKASANSKEASAAINADILSLAELINNPRPNRTIEEVLSDDGEES